MEKYINILNKDEATYGCISSVLQKYINDNKRYFKDNDSFSNITDGVDVVKYSRNLCSDSRFKPIVISFVTEGFSKDNKFVLCISSEDKTINKEIVTTKRKIYLYNLFPNQKYYYYIKSENGVYKSEVKSFYINGKYRMIYTPNSINMRDIGGKETYDGKQIKYGLVYRGCELTRRTYIHYHERSDHGSRHDILIHKEDLPFLKELNLGCDLDLRGDGEACFATESPINKDMKIKYSRLSLEGYQPFFTNPLARDDAKEIYKKIFDLIANADKESLYIHCWGGADRTGTLCFVLEALLGAKIEDLVIDYEITRFGGNTVSVKPYNPAIDHPYHEHWNFYSMVEWINKYKLPNETLSETMYRFLTKDVGISENTINKIKNIFLEDNH